MKVNLYDADDKFIGATTVSTAAAMMHISEEELTAYLKQDGYCSVDHAGPYLARLRTLGLYAQVTGKGAYDVADFLNRMIPDHCPLPNVDEWTAVMNALYALSNDTDYIVTDPTKVAEQ